MNFCRCDDNSRLYPCTQYWLVVGRIPTRPRHETERISPSLLNQSRIKRSLAGATHTAIASASTHKPVKDHEVKHD